MDAIISVEQGHEIGDRADEVEAYRTEQVWRPGIGSETGGIPLDLAGHVTVGAIGDGDREKVHAVDATVSQQVALTVGERVPVTQNLGPVRATPDEVQRTFLFHQQLGAGARPRESPRQLIVGADEEHPVDTGDGSQVKARSFEDRRQRWGMSEAVGEVGHPRLLCHAVGT